MSARRPRDDHGTSVMIATIMTVIVLLVLGGVMYFMAIEVTPSGNPVIGALSSARKDQGNYTVSIIALTNYGVGRDNFLVVVQPGNASIYVGKITGVGDCLSAGDSFAVGELHAGTTYSIYVIQKPSGSVIASLDLFVT